MLNTPTAHVRTCADRCSCIAFASHSLKYIVLWLSCKEGVLTPVRGCLRMWRSHRPPHDSRMLNGEKADFCLFLFKAQTPPDSPTFLLWLGAVRESFPSASWQGDDIVSVKSWCAVAVQTCNPQDGTAMPCYLCRVACTSHTNGLLCKTALPRGSFPENAVKLLRILWINVQFHTRSLQIFTPNTDYRSLDATWDYPNTGHKHLKSVRALVIVAVCCQSILAAEARYILKQKI